MAVLSRPRRAADPTARPAALSTLKGNIGHTKAAAGIAGLIKATLAGHHQGGPPATRHVDAHPKLPVDKPPTRIPAPAEPWAGAGARPARGAPVGLRGRPTP